MNAKMNVAVQTFSSENLHIDCLECNEAIFNPICPSCLAKQFEQWIISYPELEEVGLTVKDYIKSNKEFDGVSQTCIVCRNNFAYLCPYCFTDFLFSLLKEARTDKKILEEFFVLFNFDFEHSGYWKEAEKLGVL